MTASRSEGPGIKAGMVWNEPATQVDMAATWLGLAGLEQPATFDGKSLVPLLLAGVGDDDVAGDLVSAPTLKHLKQAGDVGKYRDAWRTSVFIEHYYVADNDKCMETCNQTLIAENSYPAVDSDCVDLVSQPNAQCWGGNECTSNCYPTESTANNFIGLRSMSGSSFGNTLYAEFETGNQGEGSSLLPPRSRTRTETGRTHEWHARVCACLRACVCLLAFS